MPAPQPRVGGPPDIRPHRVHSISNQKAQPAHDCRLPAPGPAHRRDYCRMLGGLKPSPLGDGFSTALYGLDARMLWVRQRCPWPI
jgi:hypothetical protein